MFPSLSLLYIQVKLIEFHLRQSLMLRIVVPRSHSFIATTRPPVSRIRSTRAWCTSSHERKRPRLHSQRLACRSLSHSRLECIHWSRTRARAFCSREASCTRRSASRAKSITWAIASKPPFASVTRPIARSRPYACVSIAFYA